jgi:hypothetical protein
VGSTPLDLAALYREVCSRGGCAAVTASRAWRAVATALRLPASLTSAGSTLRGHYDTCLADYEAAHYSAQRARDAGALLPGARGGERDDGDGDDDACTESGLSARCGGSASASVGGTATSAGGLARQAQQAQLPSSGSSGRFTEAEDHLILRLRLTTGGNKWKVIAEHLPGRTHASIKKHWHTTLKHKHEAIAAAAGFGDTSQPAPAAAAHALSAQLGVTALSGSPGAQLRHPVAQRLAPLDAAAATHMAMLSNHQNYLAAVAQQQQQFALAHFVASAGGAGDGEHGNGNGGAYFEGGLPVPMQAPGAGGYAGIPLIPMPPGGVFMPSGPQPPRGAGRFAVPFMQGDAAAHAALLGQQAQAQFMYPGGHAAALAAMGAAQGFTGTGGGYLSPGSGSH